MNLHTSMTITLISQSTHTSQAKLGSIIYLELFYEVQLNCIVDSCIIISIRAIYPILQVSLIVIYSYLRLPINVLYYIVGAKIVIYSYLWLPINVLYYIVGANIQLNVLYLSIRTQDIIKFSVGELSQYPSQTLNDLCSRYP